MLTYLDSLCDSLATRDLPRLRHLVVDHPLARLLPAEAMAEARRFLAEQTGPHSVPLVNLRFRDQTARLLSDLPSAESSHAASSHAELPLAEPRSLGGEVAASATEVQEPTPSAATTPLRVERPRRRRRVAAAQTELPLSA
jgi:hypothetical protein